MIKQSNRKTRNPNSISYWDAECRHLTELHARKISDWNNSISNHDFKRLHSNLRVKYNMVTKSGQSPIFLLQREPLASNFPSMKECVDSLSHWQWRWSCVAESLFAVYSNSFISTVQCVWLKFMHVIFRYFEKVSDEDMNDCEDIIKYAYTYGYIV